MLELLKNEKVFFIRFIPPDDVGTKDKAQNLPQRMGLSVPVNLSNSPDKSSAAQKSLSISHLLHHIVQES